MAQEAAEINTEINLYLSEGYCRVEISKGTGPVETYRKLHIMSFPVETVYMTAEARDEAVAAREALKALPPIPAPAPLAPIKATRQVKANIDRLKALRAQKAAIEAETKALTAEIIAFAGDKKRQITWGQTTLASIVESSSTITDTKGLAQAFPEAFDLFVSKKPYAQVR